jgi:DNA transposition AAA+ family ATPase
MNPLDILAKYPGGPVSPEYADISLTGFSLKKMLLPHSRFSDGLRRIASLHHYSQQNKVGGGILLTGPSGLGKTTILEHYLELFPRVTESTRTRIPVLYVTTPASPTVKSMAEAILVALGDPMARRGGAEEKTFRIYQLLQACQVELLLIDEFQHFCYAHSIVEFRSIADWLKNVISLTGLGVVLCGLPEAEMVIQSNEQLARRFSTKYSLTPFRLDPEDDFKEFRGILKAFQSALPLVPEEPLYEANLARRFIMASNGLLDYVRKILEGALVVAGNVRRTTLDLDLYAAGFRTQIWSDVPDRLNPFNPKSPLRPLIRPGEPFYAGDKRHAIGSPLARRLHNVRREKEA